MCRSHWNVRTVENAEGEPRATAHGVCLLRIEPLAGGPRGALSFACGRLHQQPLVLQPFDAELRPARGELLVLPHAEIVIARRVDVQLGRHAGAFQGEVHERAVLGQRPTVAWVVVGGVGQEDRGRAGGNLDPGASSSLSLAFK